MIEKLRIALYLPLYGTVQVPCKGLGGAERRLSSILSEMDGEVFEKTLVLFSQNAQEQLADLLGKYTNNSVRIINFHNQRDILLHFAKTKYDLMLYTDCLMLSKMASIGALLAGTERLLVIESIHHANWSFAHKWHGLLMRMNIALATYIDCLYPTPTTVLQKKFPNKSFSTTPCCLPRMSSFICDGTKREKTILFSGRLIQQKNPILFVEGVAKIKEELHKRGYIALLCGIGPDDDKVKSAIESNKCGQVIKMMNYQNMEMIIPKTRIFCSLQDEDNYPSQSLLEAIAGGCYCIATDVGDTKLLIHSEFGQVVEPNATSVAQAILDAIRLSDDQFAKVVTNASNFAKNNFDIVHSVGYFTGIIEKMCDNKAREI